MKKVYVLVLFCFFVLGGVSHAVVNVGLNDVIKALETPFKVDVTTGPGGGDPAIHDFRANFFQQSRMASLDRIQRGRGEVWVMFDRVSTRKVPVVLFKWLYDQPTNQEIVTDGRTLWVYLPENNQVIESDIEFVSQESSTNPVTFLSGLGNLSRDFWINWANPNKDIDGNYILELQPKQTSSMISRLLLVVNRDAVIEFRDFNPLLKRDTGDVFPLLSSTVYDPSGNSTIIEFSDIRINNGFSEIDFEFTPPPFVEVLRPTGQGMGF